MSGGGAPWSCSRRSFQWRGSRRDSVRLHRWCHLSSLNRTLTVVLATQHSTIRPLMLSTLRSHAGCGFTRRTICVRRVELHPHSRTYFRQSANVCDPLLMFESCARLLRLAHCTTLLTLNPVSVHKYAAKLAASSSSRPRRTVVHCFTPTGWSR